MIRHRLASFCLAVAAVLGATTIVVAQDMDACIGASEKALVLRKAGKFMDARASLSKCAAALCPDAVRVSCQQRLVDMNRAIPSIVLATKDGSGRDVTSAKLTVDGTVYADGLGGSAIQLDPGEHEFRFEFAGQTLVKRFVLRQGEQGRREEVVIGAPSKQPALTAPPAAAEAAATTASSTAESGSARGSSMQTTGLIIGGVGLAALATGAVFGALALSAHNDYEKNCGANIGGSVPPNTCNAQGASGEQDAANKGDLSTIFFVVGGGVLAAGAALYFLWPSGRSDVRVGIGPDRVLLTGRF
ncbi:MAG: hypothetical protein ABTD50_05410 [Polyangiaceae bacterium]|jgi:hypothetical protein